MTCRTCAHCPPGRVGITEVLGRAFSVASDCTLRRMARACEGDDDVLLLQPDIGEHVYALDFSQGGRLMEAGYEFARPRLEAWLGGGSERRSGATRRASG